MPPRVAVRDRTSYAECDSKSRFEGLLRNLLKYRLQRQYKVTAVVTGKEALEAIAREKPDLILSDIMMPELNGWELYEALQDDVET